MQIHTPVMGALFVGALVVPIRAQTVTIPASATVQDGTGILPGPGFDRAGRHQYLLGASHLAAAQDTDLVALRFRREGALPDLKRGSVTMAVIVSASSLLDPRVPSPVFAANHRGSPTTVFQGTVSLPDAPRLVSRHTATWSLPDAVTVPFATPWHYGGGTLCVQVDGAPVVGNTTAWWPIDAERAAGGTVVTRGQACGALGAQVRQPAAVDPRLLAPGTTVAFTTLAAPASASVLMLSATQIGPIDLAFLGAPGCQLHVLPETSIPAAAGAALLPGRPGAAAVGLHVPYEGRLVSASFFAQWAVFDGVALATTNALDITLAPGLSALDASVVLGEARGSVFPDEGRIDASLMPVLQIDFRR